MVAPQWSSCLENEYQIRKEAIKLTRTQNLSIAAALWANYRNERHWMEHWVTLLTIANTSCGSPKKAAIAGHPQSQPASAFTTPASPQKGEMQGQEAERSKGKGKSKASSSSKGLQKFPGVAEDGLPLLPPIAMPETSRLPGSVSTSR